MIRLKHFMKKESSSLPQADASMPISAGFFAPLGFDIPYIAENGSMCVYKEEVLATGLTPSKTIRHILDALMGIPEDLSHRTLYPFCKDTYYSDSTGERFIDYMENDIRQHRYLRAGSVCDQRTDHQSSHL